MWDGLPAHQSHAMYAWLRRQRSWLVGEPLPGYAPELNPDEGIGNSLKRVELGTVCCSDLAALAVALRRAKERLRHKRSGIQVSFRQAGYHV